MLPRTSPGLARILALWIAFLLVGAPSLLAECPASAADAASDEMNEGSGEVDGTGGAGQQEGEGDDDGTDVDNGDANLNGQGDTGPRPTAMIVPEGMEEAVDAVEQQFGFQVAGNGVNQQNLQHLVNGISIYRRESFEGLPAVEILDMGRPIGSGDVAGRWGTLKAEQGDRGLYMEVRAFTPTGGGSSEISPYAAGHEIGHHVAELRFQREMRSDLRAALGPQQQGGPGVFTPYALANEADFLAEGIAGILYGSEALDGGGRDCVPIGGGRFAPRTGGAPIGDERPLTLNCAFQEFDPPPQAVSIVEQFLGPAGPGISGGGTSD